MLVYWLLCTQSQPALVFTWTLVQGADDCGVWLAFDKKVPIGEQTLKRGLPRNIPIARANIGWKPQ